MKRDLVIQKEDFIHRSLIFSFFNNPFWININSKIFIIEDNICWGYYDIARITELFPEVFIRFGRFHQIKEISMENFNGLWQYRDFSYISIKNPRKTLKEEPWGVF